MSICRRIGKRLMTAAMGVLAAASVGKASAADKIVPAKVKALTDRMEGCVHWGGESGEGDAARRAQIDKAWKDLGCDNLKKDFPLLWRRYAKNKAARKALASADDQWSAAFGESLIPSAK